MKYYDMIIELIKILEIINKFKKHTKFSIVSAFYVRLSYYGIDMIDWIYYLGCHIIGMIGLVCA